MQPSYHLANKDSVASNQAASFILRLGRTYKSRSMRGNKSKRCFAQRRKS